MIVFDIRCRDCCCKHYNEDYMTLHPEYDPKESIGDKILRLAKERIE